MNEVRPPAPLGLYDRWGMPKIGALWAASN